MPFLSCDLYVLSMLQSQDGDLYRTSHITAIFLSQETVNSKKERALKKHKN